MSPLPCYACPTTSPLRATRVLPQACYSATRRRTEARYSAARALTENCCLPRACYHKPAILLCACYQKSGTESGYAAMRVRPGGAGG
eukprot:2653591-Rhodomonas_salina.3